MSRSSRRLRVVSNVLAAADQRSDEIRVASSKTGQRERALLRVGGLLASHRVVQVSKSAPARFMSVCQEHRRRRAIGFQSQAPAILAPAKDAMASCAFGLWS